MTWALFDPTPALPGGEGVGFLKRNGACFWQAQNPRFPSIGRDTNNGVNPCLTRRGGSGVS